ncbi:MAG: dTDP-4-dehydrorhamnose reductase [Bacteroidia bacterium]|nr:dTDP-4-dehydrorhamnose reductase [Bacteroidia bacterium]MBP9688064.1 dTDP-4-dehydrorhamnose reductase [Bacteroidia bacterium]
MKKAIILGAQGQLGSDITNFFTSQNIETITPARADLDIKNLMQVKGFLAQHRPDVIINTAAYHNVDLCEENPKEALNINATAPAFIARMCNYLKIKFVHFSTDYVFDGEKNSPYNELDKPNPLNVYGQTKYAGENAILAENQAALILRVSALYGVNPCRAKNGLNFIQLMLKLANERPSLNVVGDEFVSPTATADIAKLLPALIKNELSGIVHLTSEGSCSWHEFASTIFQLTNTKVEVNKVDSSFFPSKTPRPKYSVLENASLKNRGIASLPHWKDALQNYLKQQN